MNTTRGENIETILSLSTERELLEQLAEECFELGKAALKLIRAKKLSGNPTPTLPSEAEANLLEEFVDILIVMDVLGVKIPDYQNSTKYERWADRLKKEYVIKNSEALMGLIERLGGGIDD